MIPDVSVVVPAYNEAENLPELVRRTAATLDALALGWELVVVDDGSLDGTSGVLQDLAAREPRLRPWASRRRRGQTAALRAGLQRARGRIVVTMDADLQNPPEEIPRLLAALGDVDVVSGWRRRRRDGWLLRRLPSRVANAMIRRLTGVPIHDHGCALKAYRREVVDMIHLFGDHHRLLTAVCALSGARVKEIEVTHQPRRRGRSKYGVGRVWRVLIDAATMRMLIRHRRRPSFWFFGLAFPSAVGATAAAALALAPLAGATGHPTIVWVGAALILGFSSLSIVGVGLFAELLLRLEPSHLRATSWTHSGRETST